MPPSSNQKHEDDKSGRRSNATSLARPQQPGAVSVPPVSTSVTADQAIANLDQRIAEKRAGMMYGGGGTSSSTPHSMQQLERDVAAKQKGKIRYQAAAGTTRRDAVSMSNDAAAQVDHRLNQKYRIEQDSSSSTDAAAPQRGSLSMLEKDLEMKRKVSMGRNCNAGAYGSSQSEISRLDQRMINKQAESCRRNMPPQLTQLDQAASSKRRACATRASNTTYPTDGPRHLRGLESDVLRKQQGRSIPPKRSSGASSTPCFLRELENGVIGKQSNAPKSITGEGDETSITYADHSTYDDEYYGMDSLYTGEETLTVALPVTEDEDCYRPAAVEYDPDAKEPIFQSHRFQLYAMLSITIVIVAAIGIALGVGLSPKGTTLQRQQQLAYRESIGIQETVQRLVGTDALSEVNGPYVKALKWITIQDQQLLEPNHPRFLQRYLAAYFYYATSTYRDWDGGCQPAQGEETESCVYRDLKFTSNPPSFDSFDQPWIRWLSKVDECSWAGIQCDAGGNFRSIEFGGLNMTGNFPEGVIHFSFLQSLKMTNGELQGPLPLDLTKMKYLRSLDLSGNRFTGTIPHAWFESRSLQEMVLSRNQINGTIDGAVGQWKDALRLDLTDNQVTGPIAAEIGSMVNVRYLYLSDNLFNGTIPSSIANCRQLGYLKFNENDLTGGIPNEIGRLEALREVDLSINRFTSSIPDELYSLTSLELIVLEGNRFTGTISTSIGVLDRLWALYINDNLLTGTIPSEVGQMENLRKIVVSGNGFSGSVDSACSLPNLKILEADCSVPLNGGISEIECSCCTRCCNADGALCESTSS